MTYGKGNKAGKRAVQGIIRYLNSIQAWEACGMVYRASRGESAADTRWFLKTLSMEGES